MPKPKLLYEDTSIVLLGEFQPTIFHPQWFLNNELIRETQAKEASEKSLVVTPAVTEFSIDEWLYIFVTEQKLQLKTIHIDRNDELFDIMVGICNNIKYMPVRALGINLDSHIDLYDTDKRNNLGWRLAPTNNWDEILSNPGMRSLIMEETKPEENAGHLRVNVEPSTKFEGNTAVCIRVNDHFNIPLDKSETGCQKVITLLNEHHASSIERGKSIIESVVNLVE